MDSLRVWKETCCVLLDNIHLPPWLIFFYQSGSKGQWKKAVKLVIFNLTEFRDSLEFCRSKLPMLPYFLAKYMWWLNVSKSSGKKGKDSNENGFPASEQLCWNHAQLHSNWGGSGSNRDNTEMLGGCGCRKRHWECEQTHFNSSESTLRHKRMLEFKHTNSHPIKEVTLKHKPITTWD